jgi:ribosomal protein L11 methyltransferase
MNEAESWSRVEIDCREDLSDELSAEIAGLFGVAVEYSDAGIVVYLEGGDKAGRLEQLEELLDRFRRDFGEQTVGRAVAEPFTDMDWAERWKDHFKPFRVGRRFLISPTWEKVQPKAAERLIRIDPGQAFGTGQHETTRLCLEWVEDFADRNGDVSNRSVLDVGTGTGILAMGCALSGFGRVLGVDLDPVAIAVARENASLNGLEAALEYRSGSAGISERFDIVLANIQAVPLMEMAGDLVGRLEEGGRLVLSGILVVHAEAVRLAFEQSGVDFRERRSAGEWCLLEFEREGKENRA